MSVADFYDAFASDYDLVYGGRWEEAVAKQGRTLDRLITSSLGAGKRHVLDCSCGIGTQAIGLAMCGHRVHGTDISARAIERARREADRLGVDVTFGTADFRDLQTVDGTFDVVISCDNAIPHLLSDAEVHQALRAMRSKLRVDGLLVISVRDYDRFLAERPSTAPPLVVPGPPRRLLVRFNDWDEAGPMYDLHFFVLSEDVATWTLSAHHQTRYRALPSAELIAAARETGFQAINWHSAEEAGFYQPILVAR
jgi:2-polyprenyl-3-methyl-5-hydroxy-6-metoxy-1,4-benzoquinol methylase